MVIRQQNQRINGLEFFRFTAIAVDGSELELKLEYWAKDTTEAKDRAETYARIFFGNSLSHCSQVKDHAYDPCKDILHCSGV